MYTVYKTHFPTWIEFLELGGKQGDNASDKRVWKFKKNIMFFPNKHVSNVISQ